MSIIEINFKCTVKHITLKPYVLRVSVQQNHQLAPLVQNFEIIRKFAACISFISEVLFEHFKCAFVFKLMNRNTQKSVEWQYNVVHDRIRYSYFNYSKHEGI